jgi:hypothetical protein
MVKRYGEYGRKASQIVKRYEHYGRKLGIDMENTEENCDINNYISYKSLPPFYFPNLFTIQLTFLPYFPNHFNIQMTFIPYNLFFFHTFQILLLLDLPFFHILS